MESLNVATGELHPIQEAFVDTGALQSGYSAGAMVLAAKALLDRNPEPSEAEIRDALSGILDRETGYVKVVEAVNRAAAAFRGEKAGPMQVVVERVGGQAEQALHSGQSVRPSSSVDAPLAVPRIVVSPEVPETAVVGRSEHKVDAVRLVKGNPSFTDDVELRGMLYAKVLRSPYAHARITAIDDAAARSLAGVHAVVHYGNTTRVKYSSGGQSWPNPHPWDQVSFDDKVRHVGDRVAAVAADTPEIADEACRRIKVTYEVLPAVFDEREAIAGGAPVIHDEQDSIGIRDAAHNISHHIEGQTVTDEQMEAAFGHADRVFEQTFHVQQMQHCPIEPHITIGWLDEDERLVLRSSTQVPFHVRRMVAPLLGLEVKSIRVIKPRIGGGFGAKQEMLIEDIVGHLVLATRRPVRLELTREEEFVSSRTRHAQTITFRTGVDREGLLVAQDMRVVANTGPYGTHGFTVQSVTGLRGLSQYNCPAKRYTCEVAYTNRPIAGAFRGYGGPQALFALESHLDDIARDLSMDPVDLRRKNWVRTGDPLDIAPRLGERGAVEDISEQDLPHVTSCGIEECAAQGLRAIDWSRRLDPSWKRPPDRPSVRRGLGFALCMQGSGIPNVDMGACSIKMNDDGSFNVLFGATDLGTGADTVLAQIAAEVLGVPIEDIIVYASDTDLTPFDVGAYASSTTYISGMAVKKAAEAARARIADRGADAEGRRSRPHRAPRPASMGARRAIGVARGRGPERPPHRGPGTDHGYGLALLERVATSIRSPACRSRGGCGHRPSHGQQARNGCGLWCGHQPGDGERPGRGRHGPSARLRPHRGAGARRVGPSGERPARALLDLPGGRHAADGGVPRADDGAVGPLWGQVGGRDPNRWHRAGCAQCDPRRHRRRHQFDPSHARARLAGAPPVWSMSSTVGPAADAASRCRSSPRLPSHERTPSSSGP